MIIIQSITVILDKDWPNIFNNFLYVALFQMVVSSSGDSFFETWVHHCMPDDTGTKPLSGMTAADPNKIDMLLNQYHTGMEFKTA